MGKMMLKGHDKTSQPVQEELLQEAKRAQKRAEEMGPIGWEV